MSASKNYEQWSKLPFPDSWDRAWDPINKCIYFIDHKSKKTSWVDPRVEIYNSTPTNQHHTQVTCSDTTSSHSSVSNLFAATSNAKVITPSRDNIRTIIDRDVIKPLTCSSTLDSDMEMAIAESLKTSAASPSKVATKVASKVATKPSKTSQSSTSSCGTSKSHHIKHKIKESEPKENNVIVTMQFESGLAEGVNLEHYSGHDPTLASIGKELKMNTRRIQKQNKKNKHNSNNVNFTSRFAQGHNDEYYKGTDRKNLRPDFVATCGPNQDLYRGPRKENCFSSFGPVAKVA